MMNMGGARAVFRWRLKARLRKAPSGSRQTVDTRPGNVNATIQWWAKVGYDLHERSEWQSPPIGYGQMPIIHVILVFIKR